jgi:hypothetical protein
MDDRSLFYECPIFTQSEENKANLTGLAGLT